MRLKRKLRMAMVGGGRGAFIGQVHRMAAALDGHIELVAGCFSSDAVRSAESGQDLHLPADRVYPDYETMIRAEAARPAGDRIDMVSIVTPNHRHAGPALAALEAGFAVICDKPLALNLSEALELEEAVTRTGLPFALTHNYTGYPMVRQARALVKSGALGAIRRVLVEYPQGWLSEPIEMSGQKQADWRTDPARSGAAGAIGDIGTHAENLAEFVSGLQIESLAADLRPAVPGRRLDDDAGVLLRFEGGARGSLIATQVAYGEENNLRLRVYGERGALDWSQQEPNTLRVMDPAGVRLVRTGVGELDEQAQWATRLPAGHPEGYLEAFANIYRAFGHQVAARAGLLHEEPGWYPDFPTVQDGVRGMRFIAACVASSEANAAWVRLADMQA